MCLCLSCSKLRIVICHLSVYSSHQQLQQCQWLWTAFYETCRKFFKTLEGNWKTVLPNQHLLQPSFMSALFLQLCSSILILQRFLIPFFCLFAYLVTGLCSYNIQKESFTALKELIHFKKIKITDKLIRNTRVKRKSICILIFSEQSLNDS